MCTDQQGPVQNKGRPDWSWLPARPREPTCACISCTGFLVINNVTINMYLNLYIFANVSYLEVGSFGQRVYSYVILGAIALKTDHLVIVSHLLPDYTVRMWFFFFHDRWPIPFLVLVKQRKQLNWFFLMVSRIWLMLYGKFPHWLCLLKIQG